MTTGIGARSTTSEETSINASIPYLSRRHLWRRNKKTFAAGTLIIEPAIEDMKKINIGERIMVGVMAGSSAILLRTVYRDGASGEAIASPVFYSKASAISGALTFGGMDNAMLNRVVNLACDYARHNQ